MESVIRTATVHEIKQALLSMPSAELSGLCLRLAKFKKENKELLTYLLFEESDTEGYIQTVKKEIQLLFRDVKVAQVYLAKKTIRKILRLTNKHIRYIGSDQAETELLLCFCNTLKTSGIVLHKSVALNNLYQQQLKKIERSMETMHEDLQYEYRKEWETLKN